MNELKTTRSKDLKKEDFEKQVCMRCGLRPAGNEDSLFCNECVIERKRFDDTLRNRGVPEKKEIKDPFEEEVKEEE